MLKKYMSDLEEICNHYIKDTIFGTDIWVCKKRNMLPQKPIYNNIKRIGILDIDNMGLHINPT